jgi:hypothetical protein
LTAVRLWVGIQRSIEDWCAMGDCDFKGMNLQAKQISGQGYPSILWQFGLGNRSSNITDGMAANDAPPDSC